MTASDLYLDQSQCGAAAPCQAVDITCRLICNYNGFPPLKGPGGLVLPNVCDYTGSLATEQISYAQ